MAERFDWVQASIATSSSSVSNNQRPAGLAPLNICLQINISGESSKSGTSEQEIFRLAALVSRSERLVLRGLMAIPEHTRDEAVLAAQMAHAGSVHRACATIPECRYPLDGMTEDPELAIAHGSTMVRVGTAIFGARDYS